MTKTTSRRAVLRSAAWAVPVVTVAGAAPAFATSPEPKPKCKPVGEKFPGSSLEPDKGYIITSLGCGDYPSAVHSVTIDEKPADRREDLGGWLIKDQGNSRADLPVVITFQDSKTWAGVVHFDPWQQNK